MSTNSQLYNSKNENVGFILLYAFICLILGQLAVTPFRTTISVAFTLPTLSIIFWFIARKFGMFSFCLAFFFVCCFKYGANQGGLWNFIATLSLILIFIDKAFQKKNSLDINDDGSILKDNLLRVLLILFFCINIFGLIINYYDSPITITISITLLLSYLMMFNVMQSEIITKMRIKHFLIIFGTAVIYMFPIAFLHSKMIYINTPLLGGSKKLETIERISRSAARSSTLANGELFAEFTLLASIIFIPLLLSKQTRNKLGLNFYFILIVVLCTICNLVLAGARSCIFLSIFILGIYYLITIFRINKLNLALFFKLIFSISILYLFFNIFLINFSTIELFYRDFKQIDTNNLSIRNAVSGESINRGPLFIYGLERLKNNSWIIGKGWSTPENNRYAWTGSPTGTLLPSGFTYIDYHSLYLHLPMSFGWIGTLIFLFLLLRIIMKLFFIWRKMVSEKNDPIDNFVLSLILMWIAFMINEYKINAMREPNYFLLIWILMGFSYAFIHTYEKK